MPRDNDGTHTKQILEMGGVLKTEHAKRQSRSCDTRNQATGNSRGESQTCTKVHQVNSVSSLFTNCEIQMCEGSYRLEIVYRRYMHNNWWSILVT